MKNGDGGPSLEDTPIEDPSLEGTVTRSKVKKLQDDLTIFVLQLSPKGYTIEFEEIWVEPKTLLTMEAQVI